MAKSFCVWPHKLTSIQLIGAGDDGANCAIMLEALRALVIGFKKDPFKHNLLMLFNGAEEVGLLVRPLFIYQLFNEQTFTLSNATL